MRWMGLDIGERRIGIAYANFLELGSSIVVPGGFLEIRNREDAIEGILELVDEENITKLVAGLPLRDGFESPQCQKIRGLLQELQPRLPAGVEIALWDESLTSVAAGSLLVEAGLKHSGKKKRGRVDAVAATLILQSFVDAHRGHLPPVGPAF